MEIDMAGLTDWLIDYVWIYEIILSISLLIGWVTTYYLSKIHKNRVTLFLAVIAGLIISCLTLGVFVELDYWFFREAEGFSKSTVSLQYIGTIFEFSWTVFINLAVAIWGSRTINKPEPA